MSSRRRLLLTFAFFGALGFCAGMMRSELSENESESVTRWLERHTRVVALSHISVTSLPPPFTALGFAPS